MTTMMPIKIQTGDVINNRFRVDGLIKCGGMGCAFLGTDIFNNNKVVIKVPNYTSSNDPKFLEDKLEIEADVLSKVSHPNIVRFVARGRYMGMPYLVVEYIYGERLDDYVKRMGGLQPDKAYSIAMTLLDVLEYLHHLNIIYRDFTPDNIMIRASSEPVIIDFGTAKSGMSGIPLKGTIVRHGHFSAPELNNGIASYSSDIYMWAVVLLSMLRCGNEACVNRIERGDLIITTSYGFSINTRKPLCTIAYCGNYGNVFDKVFSSCLEADYRKRPQSVAEVKAILMGAPPPLAPGAVYLTIGNNSISLKPGESYILGREGNIKVVDPGNYVSRRHAMITYRGGHWFIQDLCSTNGTIINRPSGSVIVYNGNRSGIRSGGGVCGEAKLECGDIIGLAFSERDPSIQAVQVIFRC